MLIPIEMVQYQEKIVYLEKDMYQLMYDMAQKEKSDMVECDFFWNYPDKVKTDIGEKYKIQLEYLYARYAFCSSLLRMVKIQNEEVQEKNVGIYLEKSKRGISKLETE